MFLQNEELVPYPAAFGPVVDLGLPLPGPGQVPPGGPGGGGVVGRGADAPLDEAEADQEGAEAGGARNPHGGRAGVARAGRPAVTRPPRNEGLGGRTPPTSAAGGGEGLGGGRGAAKSKLEGGSGEFF